MTVVTRVAMLALVLTVVGGGCAAISRNEARSEENLLSAAGFRYKPADTPERRQRLAAMPPLKMVRRSKGGTVVYTYADPYNCKCVYVGSESDYQAYKRLGVQRQIAEDDLEAADAIADADQTWDWNPSGVWGWGPGW